MLFDLDGVLVDSEPIWSIAEEEVTEWLGGTWGPDIKEALLGKPLPVASAELLRVVGNTEVSADEVAHRLTEDLVTRLARDGVVLPGALVLLDALRAADVPLALVTSSTRDLVDASLSHIGADRFPVIVAGGEIDTHKPHPGPYLEAARRLGVDPRDCIAIEDSPTGIASAEAAGCTVVVVPNVVAVDPGPGRHVYASLADLTVDELRGLLA